MAIKIYVKEVKYRNADGEILTKVKTYKSRPKRYSYLIFV